MQKLFYQRFILLSIRVRSYHLPGTRIPTRYRPGSRSVLFTGNQEQTTTSLLSPRRRRTYCCQQVFEFRGLSLDLYLSIVQLFRRCFECRRQILFSVRMDGTQRNYFILLLQIYDFQTNCTKKYGTILKFGKN